MNEPLENGRQYKVAGAIKQFVRLFWRLACWLVAQYDS